MFTKKLTAAIAVAGWIVAMALAPAAMAAGSSGSVYGGEGGEQVAGVAGAASDSGTLPFTGLEVGLLALAGILLVVVGVAMARALPRHRSS
jgi:hypothetical protein